MLGGASQKRFLCSGNDYVDVSALSELSPAAAQKAIPHAKSPAAARVMRRAASAERRL